MHITGRKEDVERAREMIEDIIREEGDAPMVSKVIDDHFRLLKLKENRMSQGFPYPLGVSISKSFHFQA